MENLLAGYKNRFWKNRRKIFWWFKAQPEKTAGIRDATISFSQNWRLRKDCKNSILMTCHYPDLGSTSDWSSHEGICFKKSKALSDLGSMEFLQFRVPRTSFRGEARGGVAKCRLFPQLIQGLSVYIFKQKRVWPGGGGGGVKTIRKRYL